jgi:uncharacterized membrane protein
MADLLGITDSGNESGESSSLSGGFGGGSNKDLMADARAALSGNWGMAVLGYLLFFILLMSFSAFVFSATFVTGFAGGASGTDVEGALNLMELFANLVQLVISGPIFVGFSAFFLGIMQENSADLENLFVGFRRFLKSFLTYFFYTLFILLWSLLFIIPGIIAAFRYAMVFFIIADDQDCGAFEALGRSKEMMKGNKWKFFCLHWRFFGWALLCSILPIGWIWLVPYVQTSFAAFYEDVK